MAQSSMLFWSFFKSLARAKLADQADVATHSVRLTIELKNGLRVEGSLETVDEQMNFHLSEVRMFTESGAAMPQFSGVT